jgi:hypothetical protein
MADNATKKRGIGRILIRRYYPLINLLLLAGLVGVGIFQAIIANRQTTIYQNQARIMDEQRKIADKQWIAMQGQLDEMKAASQDTKSAIAGIQQLSGATITSGDRAETFYKSSLRAWVAYEGDPVPITPLFAGKTSVRSDMRFYIRNVGKSVASSVKLITELHILADYKSWRKDNSICTRAAADNVEISIIPDTTFFTNRKVAVVSNDELDQYENMVRREGSSLPTFLFLDTCIDYVTYESTNHQYTRTGFVITRNSNGKKIPFDIIGETVPEDVLSFEPLPDVIRAN